MPRGKSLSETEKKKILGYQKRNYSIRKIAANIKRSHTIVANFIKNPSSYGTVRRRGRKPKVTPRTKRLIINQSSNSSKSANQIIRENELEVSKTTVNRIRANCPHLILEPRIKTTVLTPVHKERRLNFAKVHMTWNKEWRQVIFSDEKKWNLDGPDGFSSYWHDLRKEPLLHSKRQAGGGSVMIWACFGYNFKSRISFIEGRMDSTKYCQLLENHIDEISDSFNGDNWIFQQDNAPCHSAANTKRWFRNNKINVMNWPAVSPDLNPIENLWGILVRQVYTNGRQFRSINDLKTTIELEWAKLSIKTCQYLILSMPNRIFEVIKNNGNKTDY